MWPPGWTLTPTASSVSTNTWPTLPPTTSMFSAAVADVGVVEVMGVIVVMGMGMVTVVVMVVMVMVEVVVVEMMDISERRLPVVVVLEPHQLFRFRLVQF